VVTAGIGGTDFQNQLKQTARVHGIQVDKMIKKEGSFKGIKAYFVSKDDLIKLKEYFSRSADQKDLKRLYTTAVNGYDKANTLKGKCKK